ncbi:hypothetical protein [Porcincola intestinalis]|uniref:hypothetical protein n=1 Tax=Porcincola intestinalis TaxID=2606632 RepID=UPI002A833F5B|nr:hypothetical protein [Porcincola intestinalis]MDY4204146.1 hypothetical protein [Porcincola intestinalis]
MAKYKSCGAYVLFLQCFSCLFQLSFVDLPCREGIVHPQRKRIRRQSYFLYAILNPDEILQLILSYLAVSRYLDEPVFRFLQCIYRGKRLQNGLRQIPCFDFRNKFLLDRAFMSTILIAESRFLIRPCHCQHFFRLDRRFSALVFFKSAVESESYCRVGFFPYDLINALILFRGLLPNYPTSSQNKKIRA